MKHFTITWKHELKKSVPFTVLFNNYKLGTIKRGDTVENDAYDGSFELYLVPDAPKLFGWKAVHIYGITTDAPNVEIVLAVTYPSHGFALRQAANSFNQLHVISCNGANIYGETHTKEYQRQPL